MLRRWATKRRVAAYTASPDRWRVVLPDRLQRRLRLEPPPAGERRVEVGSGFRPTPGYLHVEPAPDRPEVDIVSTAEAIPLPAGWADELLAVHLVEHLPAGQLPVALRHWHHLLRPGGRLELHTPDVVALTAILGHYDDVGSQRWWAAQCALFGYGQPPSDAIEPGRLGTAADHLVALSFPALRDLLTEAGFHDVTDVTGTLDCQHQRDWAQVVPGLCLEVRAIA